MNNGWIKLHRKLLDWEWYDDTNVVRVFLHLLLTANHKEKKWRGNTIMPGEKITSYAKLSEQTGLSVRQIRVALDKLIMTGEVTNRTNTKFSHIKLNKWGEYQSSDTPHDNQMTFKRQSNDNKQECKNEKNVRIYSKSNPKQGSYKDFDTFQMDDGTIATMEWGIWKDSTSKSTINRGYYKECPPNNK